MEGKMKISDEVKTERREVDENEGERREKQVFFF